MGYALTLDIYQGPLEKLLELIEEKKLAITQVNLATVTADFLAYVQKLTTPDEKNNENRTGTHIPPEVLVDFLAIASKLVLLKSKELLPSLSFTQEEEEDVKDLELRLQLYQELKGTQRVLQGMWSQTPQFFTREFLMGRQNMFYPPEKYTAHDMAHALHRILHEVEEITNPVITLRSHIVQLQEKIQEVIARVSANPLSFHALRANHDRHEIVVLFLAVLHLIKDQLVSVEQTAHFESMTIVRKE